jgi:hypothetical protein
MLNAGRARAIFALAATMLLLLTTQANATPSAMTKIIGGPGTQDWPAANTSFIAWSSNRPGTQVFDAWVRDLPLGSDTPIRLNKTGFQGYMGGINQDKNEAIYEQWSPKTGGDLEIVPDLSNPSVQQPAPAGINTVKWAEGFASISNNFILFMRFTVKYQYVILYDRNAHTFKTLLKAPIKCVCYGDVVTDRYATWTKSTKTSSNTYYYDTTNGHTHAFPSVAAPYVYGGAISDTSGFMYAVKSGRGCGNRPRVVRWQLGSPTPPVTIAAFPSGFDTYGVAQVVNDTVNDTLYIEGLRCGSTNDDVYQVTLANT